jgi:hypothetical protein
VESASQISKYRLAKSVIVSLVETPVPVRFFLELKSFEQDRLLDRID